MDTESHKTLKYIFKHEIEEKVIILYAPLHEYRIFYTTLATKQIAKKNATGLSSDVQKCVNLKNQKGFIFLNIFSEQYIST